MAIVTSVPKLISAKILRILEKNLIAKKICTIEADIKGDTATFPGLSPITISDYTGSISAQDLKDAGVTLVIDQQKYYAAIIEDIESFRSVMDIKNTAIDDAAYRLADAADQFILGKYADANTTVTATVSETIAFSTTGTALRKLEEKNIRPGNRWLVIPPWYEEKLDLAGLKFSVLEGFDGAKDGMSWAQKWGTDIYVSNNLTTTGSEGSYNTQCLAGSYNAIVYAQQIIKNRVFEQINTAFAGQIDGLLVYGAKVVKPEEVVRINATQAAASTTI